MLKNPLKPLYVTGGANKSPEILRRVAAIWNKPVVRIEEAGAALGAAAAGAYAFLKTTGKEVKIEEINKKLLKRDDVIHPLAEDVKAYHSSGGYLEKLSAWRHEKIIKEHIQLIRMKCFLTIFSAKNAATVILPVNLILFGQLNRPAGNRRSF